MVLIIRIQKRNAIKFLRIKKLDGEIQLVFLFYL